LPTQILIVNIENHNRTTKHMTRIQKCQFYTGSDRCRAVIVTRGEVRHCIECILLCVNRLNRLQRRIVDMVFASLSLIDEFGVTFLHVTAVRQHGGTQITRC
jgi:hypothetical protein